MANPTTSFGWVMPTSSSLVTNLPADFNTFGQAVDTSMQYLLGGTTGQVLSKTSGTNMAFTWVTPTDQTPLTTKGDLFTFSTVDARLGVGSDGQVLTASSAAATGLAWATASSGGMTLLSTTSLSGTSTFITGINQTYRNLWFTVVGAGISTISQLACKWYGATGSSGSYYGNASNNTSIAAISGTTYAAFPSNYNTSSNGNTIIGTVYDYARATGNKIVQITAYEDNNNQMQTITAVNRAVSYTANAITAIGFLSVNGTSTLSGTVYLYGVN